MPWRKWKRGDSDWLEKKLRLSAEIEKLLKQSPFIIFRTSQESFQARYPSRSCQRVSFLENLDLKIVFSFDFIFLITEKNSMAKCGRLCLCFLAFLSAAVWEAVDLCRHRNPVILSWLLLPRNYLISSYNWRAGSSLGSRMFSFGQSIRHRLWIRCKTSIGETAAMMGLDFREPFAARIFLGTL